MSLRARLVVLFAVLTLLPALPAAWVTQGLLQRTVDIAMRDDVDAALDAGVRQTRAALALQRNRLREIGSAWERALDDATDPRAVDPSFSPADVRVEWIEGVLVPGTTRLDSLPEQPERGAPPFRLTHRVAGLTLTAAVDPIWRADAVRTSEKPLDSASGMKGVSPSTTTSPSTSRPNSKASDSK